MENESDENSTNSTQINQTDKVIEKPHIVNSKDKGSSDDEQGIDNKNEDEKPKIGKLDYGF